MKVISLLENTTNCDNIEIEHGLSIYIEYKGYKILFDMGQTDLFAKNAEKLGVDLTEVDFAVLSHGHYDHGGGMETFFKINHTADVYLTKYAFEPHFNGKNKYIGLDKKLFKYYRDRLIFTEDENVLPDDIYIFNCNNNHPVVKLNPYGLKRGVPKIITSDNLYNFNSCLKPGEPSNLSELPENTELKLIPDDFLHEQYLYFKNNKKILFSGCSHKGILNIMSWCNPDILIGGFHFKSLPMEGEEAENSKKVLTEAAEVLKKYNCKYYTCHCTGVPQYEFLKSLMGDQLDYFSAGMSIEL